MGARPAVRMADITAMRGASVSPSFEDVATSQSLEYAARQDEGMLQATDDLLGGQTGGRTRRRWHIWWHLFPCVWEG